MQFDEALVAGRSALATLEAEQERARDERAQWQVQEAHLSARLRAATEAMARANLVIVEAEHLCMTMRGVKKPGSRMITSAVRGVFQKNDITRKEALQLIEK